MNKDIDSITIDKAFSQVVTKLFDNKRETEYPTRRNKLSKEQIEELIHKDLPNLDLEKLAEDLDRIAQSSEFFNKRVKLSVNKDINRIIITIVDKNSNEIIKEIPCKELQNLAYHLKKAIGILFDKTA